MSPRKGEKLDMVSHIQESKHLKKTLASQEATGATRSWDIPGLFLLLLFSFLFLAVDFFFSVSDSAGLYLELPASRTVIR